MTEILEPQFGDIFEWPHAPVTGKRSRRMFICRDNKHKTESALEDTMTAITVQAGDYAPQIGEISNNLGPVRLYVPIEQSR